MGQTQTKVTNKNNEKVSKYVAKEEYFIKNGGILLEKQIALSNGQGEGQLRILSVEEIEKATNHYHPDLILGNRRRVVYKGTLGDRSVVVKAPRELELNPELNDLDLFLTEAATGMVMHHDNVAKLYGCCLETYIPILVYEFLPNKYLAEHLHGNDALKKRLKWADRLRIATDTAYALSYMHNGFSKPMVHRDVKSMSILLDDSFNAKLTNTGYSVSITPGETTQIWPALGTPGYIDPEYVETHKLTDKCDVYSFGVLLLELVTGRQPIAMARSGTHLVDLFASLVEKDRIVEMIDSEVLKQTSMDEIQRVIRLALSCVAMKGAERPTMIDVVKELWLMAFAGVRQ